MMNVRISALLLCVCLLLSCAATAALARLCPEAFALLARRLGGSHSLLARMTPGEAAALLAEVRALPR